MEYGDAVTSEAYEQAVAIGRELLRSRQMPLQAIATLAVSQAYCVCVTDGEDAAERGLSELHRRLINSVSRRLSGEVAASETRPD